MCRKLRQEQRLIFIKANGRARMNRFPSTKSSLFGTSYASLFFLDILGASVEVFHGIGKVHIVMPNASNSRKCSRARANPRSAGLEPLSFDNSSPSTSVALSPPFPPSPNDSRQQFTISLQNSGDTAVRGGVQFDIYLLTEGSAFNANADILLGQFVRTGTLAGGAPVPFTFTAPLSAAIAGGQYQLVAVIDPNNRVAETNETNNIVQSSTIHDYAARFRPGAGLRAECQTRVAIERRRQRIGAACHYQSRHQHRDDSHGIGDTSRDFRPPRRAPARLVMSS